MHPTANTDVRTPNIVSPTMLGVIIIIITVNVGRIKPRSVYISVALALSRFVRSGKDQQANMANPLLANTRPLDMNEPFLRMDERLLRETDILLRLTGK